VNITLFEDDSLFLTLSAEWDELLADSTADQIFLTPIWQQVWWDAYHPGHIWALVVRDDGGRLQGIAPWFRGVESDGLAVLHAIGCEDVTDYVDVIARRGYEEAVFAAISDYIAEHANQFDKICLCNFPETSSALAWMPRLLEDRGLFVSVSAIDVCPVITLPDRWEDYVAGLDKKNRHELRRKLRRAEGAEEGVGWYIVGPKHNLQEELERFLRLMAASSPDKSAFLADPGNTAFFQQIVPCLMQRGWLQLAFLTVGGEAAAAYLNFVYGDRVMVYNSGLEPGRYGHLSPGIVLMGRLIEHAIMQGYKLFDFLRGDEAYKYHLGGKDTHVYQLVIRSASRG